MNSQDLRALQEAYIGVYEDWKSPNVDKLKVRMGGLERQIPNNDRVNGSPELARYQRVADVVKNTTSNPSKPFQKPSYKPNQLVKTDAGLKNSPEQNPQWQQFSTRLPNQPKPTQSKPSTSSSSTTQSKPSTSSSSTTQSKPSTSSSSSTQTRGAFANRLTTNRSGNGQLRDRSGDYGASLRARGSSSKGGGSTAQLASGGRSGGYKVGGSQGFGISGIKLADSYDLYDIILSHLLDEGYADTQEQAEAIMVNMSEDWRESIILEQSLPSNYTDYKSPAVQASHARSMGSASRMRQMGMNATSVDPKDDAQSNLNAVKSGNGVAKPLSGTTIKSGAGKGFKVGDPGINIGPSK